MIKLYLDEDAPEAIAKALRLRGYDVVTVKEAARKGMTDIVNSTIHPQKTGLFLPSMLLTSVKSILNLSLRGLIMAVLSFPSSFQ